MPPILDIYVRGSFIAGQIGSNGLFSGIGISFRGGSDSAAFSAIGFVSGVPVAGLSASAVAGWQGVGGVGSAFLFNAGRSFDAFWPSNLALGYVEGPAEVVSIGIGLASLKYNIEEGNYGEAALDVLTTSVDAGLVVLPVAPGVTSALNAARRSGSASRRLGRALEAAGMVRNAGEEAHHLVPHGAKAAKEAQKILERFGVGIDSAENGVFLPASFHRKIHSQAYIRDLTTRLGAAESYGDVVEVLKTVRVELLEKAGR